MVDKKRKRKQKGKQRAAVESEKEDGKSRMEFGLKRCSTVEQHETGEKDDAVSNKPRTWGFAGPSLKRCSEAEQNLSSKEEDPKTCLDVLQRETSKEDHMPNKTETVGASRPSDGTTPKVERKTMTFFERMRKKYDQAQRTRTRVLSPRAERLYDQGIKVEQIISKLGNEAAFTSWCDGASIRVETDWTGQRVLRVFGHDRQWLSN